MIGIGRADELVEIGEVLERAEVVGHRTERGVVHAPFDLVGVGSVARRFKEVAERPRVVGNVASFVAPVHAVAAHVLCRSGAAVGENMVAHEFPFSIRRLVEVFLFAGIGIQYQRYLQFLAVGGAVYENRLVALALRRRNVTGPVVDLSLPLPRLLRDLEKFRVTGLAVRP